ncbi:MAG: response regulator transcription factor [Cyclobacteriaceae bacterium]
MMNCVVVDDEPLAREGLIGYINQISCLNLVGEGSNPVELNELLDSHSVDLIFLDIQMPVINGVDYLKMNKNLPIVIFTTAYPSYALEGYQLDVLDYLLKPITFDRFFQAVTKAREFFQLKNSNQDHDTIRTEDHFFIKCDGRFEKIQYDDILFIQAQQNYVTIFTKGDQKFMTLLNLKSVSNNLNEERFIKVHKSFIVAKDKVEKVEHGEVIIGPYKVPISRSQRDEVMNQIIGKKLWKK